MKTRLNDEKDEFEKETKNRLLSEIQDQQSNIEDSKHDLAQQEVNLRADYRKLEKQEELLQLDREETLRL